MPSDPSSYVAPSKVQLLSNGRYGVALGAAGSGYSQWNGMAVTRWREDPVGDAWGSYILLRDEDSGEIWSTSCQPLGDSAGAYASTLCSDHVRITHCRGALTSELKVAVVSDRDIECRRVTLSNTGDRLRDITLTSYAELILGSPAGDASHPAFSKLFVVTEWLGEEGIVLATRRRRSDSEQEIWAAHRLVIDRAADHGYACETDRLAFLGRGRTLRNAAGMQPGHALSSTVGCVLDPIFSVRGRLKLKPGESARATFWTAVADSREAVLALMRSLDADDASDKAFAGAKQWAERASATLGISQADADMYDALVGPLLYADAAWRGSADALGRAQGGAPTLWSGGISGDRPIALFQVSNQTDVDGVDELLKAQCYWRSRGLGVDVVLLDTADGQQGELGRHLQQQIDQQKFRLSSPEGVVKAEAFLLFDDSISDALRDGLEASARLVLDASRWSHLTALRVHTEIEADTPSSISQLKSEEGASEIPAPSPPREFDNGLGGFIDHGRSYEITLENGACTPAPWINVIANADFGFLVSAEGGGYTWSENSQQNALTPWPNDPVSDVPHEVLYLRDDESGALWSATALPIRAPDAIYSVEHGKGYSRFRHTAYGIESTLLQFVPVSGALKLSRLRLHNHSSRTRRLSITGYVQWALGPNGSVTAPFLCTAMDPATGALFASNAWRAEFNQRVAFIDFPGRSCTCTGDRLEFLGRYGTVERPAALMSGAPLSGRTGMGMSPCGALQTVIEIAAGDDVELTFVLGEAQSREACAALVASCRQMDLDVVFKQARDAWRTTLDVVQVRTPDRAMDILINDWLVYQALGCRMWARTAYYQASGAYGFRDQLQDAMALCVARPELTRQHLLRAAARQFPEGDVQHWWLPPSGQGIRTRIRDDRVWLPYAAAHYVLTTGDSGVLEESLPFLDGAALKQGETDAFFQPGVSKELATLYEHASRAIDSSLTCGAHGLPLIGTGDWNDGMNNVGAQGRGESIWLAWFLVATIDAFAPLAEARSDDVRARQWRDYADKLRVVLDSDAGWDGDWYRRGYYDDGTPLGSRDSDECKIDVIAQSWSLMAGGTHVAHIAKAMASVQQYLIRQDDRIALLFTPPFDHTKANPGYIKGYPPGIRENGGQYTHGATWSIFAYAKLGQGENAAQLFDMLNPIRHADSPDAVARYKVEPYIGCADVYSVAPHVGRGGWTWYSGTAGWLYRAGVEAILGFQLKGDHLLLDPCIPRAWPGYSMVYRRQNKDGTTTRYDITVENPTGASRGVAQIELDGVALPPSARLIPLAEDCVSHTVRVTLGSSRE